MKKNLLFFLILLTPTFCGADSGVYLGAGVSGNVLSGNQSLLAARENTGEASFKNYGLRDTKLSAEIIAGWGLTWRFAYIGIEGNYSFLKTHSELRSHIAGDKDELLTTKLGNGYGAAFRFGCWATQSTLIYTRIGWESRKISLDFHDDDEQLVSVHKKYRSHAFAPGIGVEVKLTKHLVFRLEAKGAFYPNKHFNVVKNSSDYTQVKSRPRLYSLMLGVIYIF